MRSRCWMAESSIESEPMYQLRRREEGSRSPGPPALPCRTAAASSAAVSAWPPFLASCSGVRPSKRVLASVAATAWRSPVRSSCSTSCSTTPAWPILQTAASTVKQTCDSHSLTAHREQGACKSHPGLRSNRQTDSSSSSSSAPACYGQRCGTVPTSQVRPRTTRCDAANGAGRPGTHQCEAATQRQQSTGATALGCWLRPPKRRTAARAAPPRRPRGRGSDVWRGRWAAVRSAPSSSCTTLVLPQLAASSSAVLP
jgi:hypothetical protein